MRLTVTQARARLSDLVKQAEAGEDIILTLHGKEVARITRMDVRPSAGARRKVIETVRRQAAHKPMGGPVAARSQDFLYELDSHTG